MEGGSTSHSSDIAITLLMGTKQAFTPKYFPEKIAKTKRPILFVKLERWSSFFPAKCLLFIIVGVHTGQNEQVYHSRALVPKIFPEIMKFSPYTSIALRFRKCAFGEKSNIRTLGVENPRSFSSLGPR